MKAHIRGGNDNRADGSIIIQVRPRRPWLYYAFSGDSKGSVTFASPLFGYWKNHSRSIKQVQI